MSVVVRPFSYQSGNRTRFTLSSVLANMENLHLDGPSAQLLADGTRSTHVFDSFQLSAVQYSLISHALWRVGLVPLMKPNLAASLST